MPFCFSLIMNTDRTCGCKGYNSCYICEIEFDIPKVDLTKQLANQYGNDAFIFCADCKRVVLCNSWNVDHLKSCQESDSVHDKSITNTFPGVQIVRDFISETEELKLMQDLDALSWDTSQSGRRKQNFGPRANFKKRKAKAGEHFRGFPKCTKYLQDRFNSHSSLEGYRTIEQCSIEYRPEFGACIEPHIDDCWIWGERIVQLNLLR